MFAPLIEDTDPATAGDLLDAMRDAKHREHAAARDQLVLVGHWCDLHPAESISDAAAYARMQVDGREKVLAIGGPGCPLVAEFSLAELGAVLGIRTEQARDLAGEVLELRHRLPKCWKRMLGLKLPAWRARRIARATLHLSVQAAGFVDAQIAHVAHSIGPAATDRLIDDATQKFMPGLAEKQRAAAADQRCVQVDTRTATFRGTTKIYGEIDFADALDLDAALYRRAAALAHAGSTAPLDVRRAIALGDLARGQDGLETTREVVIHVHTTEEAVHANTDTDQTDGSDDRDLTQTCRVETRGRKLLTLEQIRLWCGGAAKITIKPVIDLNASIHVEAYEVPDRISHQAEERDVTCVFPWCTRPAAACDSDHIIPYADGGPTSTSNIAKLCRSHHRLKTHSGWTYHCLEPGTYLWRSPHGLTLHRGPHGSQLAE